jgi:hypothetical protein
MNEFFAVVRVDLHSPVRSEGDVLVGYYVQIGVAAEDQNRAKSLIANSIQDGKIDWNDPAWFEPSTLKPSLTRRRINAKASIIWFKSARILFPASDEAN